MQPEFFLVNMKLKNADDVFILLRSAIYGEKIPENFSPDWKFITKCMNYSMLAPVFSALDEETNDKLNNNFEDSLMVQIYQQSVISAIKEISATALERKIPFAVLKGVVLGTAYPDASTRVSGDIDFYVHQEYLYSFSTILEELGGTIKATVEEGQSGVIEYILKSGIVVEIHAFLAMSLTKRQSIVLQKYGMFDEKTFVDIQLDDTDIPTLDLTNQLVYMIYHFGKHLAFGSANIRMLLDISVYVDHYNSRISKKRFRDMIEELGFERFANAIFSVCKEKTGMTYNIWDANKPTHSKRLIHDITGCYYHGLRFVVGTMEISNSTDKFSKHKLRSWRITDVFRHFKKILKNLLNPFVLANVFSQYIKQWFWNLNNMDRKSWKANER